MDTLQWKTFKTKFRVTWLVNEWLQAKQIKPVMITVMDNVFTAQASKNVSDEHTFLYKNIYYIENSSPVMESSHFPFPIMWQLLYLTSKEA